MYQSPEIAAQLDDRYAKLALAVANKENVQLDPSFWIYLRNSELQLIQLMSGLVPPPDAPGNVEVSWLLYFLNNDAPSWVTTLLRDLGMPPSRITSADWAKWTVTWENHGVVTGDGSLMVTSKFAVMDPGWAIAFINYILLELDYIHKHAYNPIGTQLTLTGASNLRLALFGDWGTGAYTDGSLPASPSQLIAQQINALKPDISIHLGDVYYGGTEDEEQSNLVNCTRSVPFGNFTLNSNHEMYDGANGYFTTALEAPVFAKQKGASFFSITFGNWLIIGLDTAYFDSSFLFMDGALKDPAQVKFLQQAGASGKKIFLLSHHNPINEVGNGKQMLWAQVITALGRQPDYWYWGHVHNGIVYSPNSAGGSTACRCLGNSAIPIGNAPWFVNQPSISFFTNKRLANPGNQQYLRVLNGFAIIEFVGGNVYETWYYQDGTIAWKS